MAKIINFLKYQKKRRKSKKAKYSHNHHHSGTPLIDEYSKKFLHIETMLKEKFERR